MAISNLDSKAPISLNHSQLPEFISNSSVGSKERENIVRELSLYEGDARLQKLFEVFCQVFRHKNDPTVPFTEIFSHILKI